MRRSKYIHITFKRDDQKTEQGPLLSHSRANGQNPWHETHTTLAVEKHSGSDAMEMMTVEKGHDNNRREQNISSHSTIAPRKCECQKETQNTLCT